MRLEPVGMAHVGAIQALAADPAIVATTRLPDPYSADGARRFVEYMMPRQAVASSSSPPRHPRRPRHRARS